MLPSVGFAVLVAALSSLGVCLLLVNTKSWHGTLTFDSSFGVQKFHTAPTPRVGGAAIIAGIASAYVVAPPAAASMLGLLLVAAAPAFAAGLLEDLTKKIGVLDRLAATLSSGVLGWWLTGAVIHQTGVVALDGALSLAPVAVVFTAFAVGGMANAVNIIDGFNGLAGGVVLIMLASLGVMAAQFGDADLVFICLLIGGPVLGFLAVNWPSGRIFLGDGGAYLLGFLVGWIAVMLLARHPQLPAWAPLLACAYPVLEVAFSFYRKSRRAGSSPGQPDRVHLHMLVYRRLVRPRLARSAASVQNAMTSPFAWAYAASTAAWAAVFARDTPLLVAGFGLAALAYSRFYTRLAKFRWWPRPVRVPREHVARLQPVFAAAGPVSPAPSLPARRGERPAPRPRMPVAYTGNAHRTGRLMYAVLGASSCFALIEPAPFEVIALLLLGAHVAFNANLRAWRLAGRLTATTLTLLALFAILQFVPVALQAHSPGQSAFYAAVTTMLMLIAVHLGQLHGRGDHRFSAFLAGYAVGALFSAALALASLAPSIAAVLPGTLEWAGRPKAFFKDPNVFGPYLIPAVVLFLEAAGRRHGLRMLLFLLCAVICAGGVIASASRAAWVNLAVVLALYGTFSCARQRVMLVAGAALAVLAVVPLAGAQPSERMQQTIELYGSRLQLQEYDEDRFEMAHEAVELGLRFPAGVGPGEVASYLGPSPGMDPHNTYVRIWAENGPVALGLFSVILLLLGTHAVQECMGDRRLDPRFICAFALLAGALVNAGVVDTLHWRHFWVILAVCIFSFNRRARPAPSRRPALLRT